MTARSARDWLSIEVLVPASHLLQRARPSRSKARSAYFDGIRFRREAATWGSERKMQWILERLRFTTRRAYSDTPYYRELFDRIGFDPRADFSFDDLSRLPTLNRETVHSVGRALVSKRIPPDQLRRDATGGSSGTPTEIWMGPEERGWRESAGETFMRRLGMPAGTRIGSFWGHHLDPLMTDSLRLRVYGFINNTRTIDCFRLSHEHFERCHVQFERWQPACLVAYAGALGSLAEYVLARGYRPSYPTRCIVTGAEKLMPQHRVAIEAAFRKPVHERYGSRDVGFIGYQIAPGRSLDFDIDWADQLIEPEDDNEESPILVTKLHADGMPLIRYRIDDVGRFPVGSRPGYPTFRLHEIVGRVTDGIWLRDGSWVHGIELPHLMKDHPVREFMLVQRPDYSVQLMIVAKSGFAEDNLRRIRNTLASNLPGLDLKIALVDRVPRTRANKWRPVVTEVGRAPGTHS